MAYPHKHIYCRRSVDAFRVDNIYTGDGLREGAFQWLKASDEVTTRLYVRLPGAGLMMFILDADRHCVWDGHLEQPTLEPEIHAKPHPMRQFGWRGHLRAGRFESA